MYEFACAALGLGVWYTRVYGCMDMPAAAVKFLGVVSEYAGC